MYVVRNAMVQSSMTASGFIENERTVNGVRALLVTRPGVRSSGGPHEDLDDASRILICDELQLDGTPIVRNGSLFLSRFRFEHSLRFSTHCFWSVWRRA